MKITTELIQHVITQCGNNPKAIAKMIEQYQIIHDELEACKKQLGLNMEERAKKDDLVISKMNHLRTLCDHPISTIHYNRDPSGGIEDSYRKCGICNFERGIEK